MLPKQHSILTKHMIFDICLSMQFVNLQSFSPCFRMSGPLSRTVLYPLQCLHLIPRM